MTRPLIGLTGRRKKGRQIVGNLAGLEDADIDMYYCEYTRAVLAAGGVPVHLPLDVAPVDVVGRLDGLLMSGGTDIDPDRYGQESAPELIAPEAERDDFEFAVLDQAAELGVPTLGICRGLQVINVHAGGTLHQHVPEHAGFARIRLQAGCAVRRIPIGQLTPSPDRGPGRHRPASDRSWR